MAALELTTYAKELKNLAWRIINHDHGVLYGLTSFFKQAKKHGIKPLLGCEIYLVFEVLGKDNEARSKQKPIIWVSSKKL